MRLVLLKYPRNPFYLYIKTLCYVYYVLIQITESAGKTKCHDVLSGNNILYKEINFISNAFPTRLSHVEVISHCYLYE